MRLQTTRLELVAATADLVRAEINHRVDFARQLGAEIPSDWPPEMVADALPWFLQQLEADPGLSGWSAWYGIVGGISSEAPILAASGGFLGRPEKGTVEVGYSVLPAYQRQGYATEMARALVEWALAQPDVRRVIADVLPDNTPSVRLLHRLGFTEANEPSAEAGHVRYEKHGTKTGDGTR